MEDLSLHILDIAENSIRAGARLVEIRLEENTARDRIRLEVRDNGRGMPEDMKNRALDPFFTTKTTRRVGLGLPLLADSAREAGGEILIESEPGEGTRIQVEYQASHIDARPMGDIPQTLITLISGHPEVDILFSHRRDTREYDLDTREIKEQLEGIPINSPEVIRIIHHKIQNEFNLTRRDP